jgi:hypothetical protein
MERSERSNIVSRSVVIINVRPKAPDENVPPELQSHLAGGTYTTERESFVLDWLPYVVYLRKHVLRSQLVGS